MADATTVVEGKVKYREGKKWKPRWCVLKKPSPVADRLQVVLYKNVQEALKAGGKVKTSFALDSYYGLESGFELERESNVLAIVCHKHVTLLAFENREYLIQFEVKIRRSLGQEYQFPVRLVKAPTGSRLPLDSVKLLIHGSQFCVTAQVPPRVIQCWNVTDLRRFAAVDGKFCFEVGTRCGKGAGVHAVQSEQAEEISEILRINSLGKSSTTARVSNNRSSQLMDYSMAAPDPIWTQSNNTPVGAQGSGAGSCAGGPDRSPMLMCCQALPGDGGDEWGCRKRHSVSVTEFHRSSATTFQEKLRLMSIENQERQRLMAIYDVPPKHNRKLEAASGPNSSEKSTDGVSAASSLASLSGDCVRMSMAQKQTSQLSVRLDPHDPSSPVEAGHSLAASSAGSRAMVTTVAGREYCIPRSLNTSVFDSMVNAQVDTTKRNEALQTLQKQETHLHQEIVLLDQMLQNCNPQSEAGAKDQGSSSVTEETLPEKASVATEKDTVNSAQATLDSLDPDKMATLEPPLKCSTPTLVSQKAASLPSKIGTKKDPEMSSSPVKKPGTFPSTPENKAAADTPLSPHLLSKLEKIPWNSHLNTPLPYVNLAKYDAELDSGLIYLQGSGDNDSGCIAVPPRLHRNPAGGSLACLRNRTPVVPLPSRCFSETNISPGAGPGNLAPQKPLPLSPEEESESMFDSVSDGLSGSVDTLDVDDETLLPPTTYAPPIPYPRPLTTMASIPSAKPVESVYCPPVQTSIRVTTTSTVCEPLYANEPPPLPPPRSRLDTPPPELPPKGPALLRKSKLRSSGGAGSSISNTVPPAPPVRTRSLSVGSQGKFCDYDNQPGPKTPPAPPPPPPQPEPKKGAQGEDNYLHMGSPKNQSRREHPPSIREGDSSRPSSLYVTSSPKPRAKGLPPPARRGNADVLSGYMDMANIIIDEPKHDLDHALNSSGQEAADAKDLSECAGGSSMPPDGNYMYMEMSNFPPPVPSSTRRKSAVLKNLEALQTYVSTTPAGESAPKPLPSDSPGTPSRSNTPVSNKKSTSSVSSTPASSPPAPSTPIRSTSTYSPPAPSTPVRSTSAPSTPPTREKLGNKVYNKIGSLDGKGSPGKSLKRFGSGGAREKPRPAMPFTNLKHFEQKQPKASYVNTYIPAPDVPLPEPPKKEEGFFARLIRRNSKDKNAASQSQENLNVQKNRTSVFERSMSEQGEPVDEKANSKLKVGRRRSASFPNRLSFQETAGSAGAAASTPNKNDTPPPLPPPIKSSASVKSSSSTRSSSSSSSKSSSKQAAANSQDNSAKSRQDTRSDNSSVHELSDDSDLAPLLRRGNSSKGEMRVLTVLHVQQDTSVNPMANICADLTPCSSADCLSTKLSDASSSKQSDSSFSLSGSSKTTLSNSSKTDDEKLIELFEHSKRQSVVSDIEDIKSKMSLPLDQEALSPKEEAAAIARHVATIPPLIPPKSKKLLSPVSEVSSGGTPSPSATLPSPSPPAPPQHPVLPSAPNQDEAIYVDMKELLPQPPRGPASPTAASLHPYNCPREQKERARATLRITPAVEDEEGNIWVPRRYGAGGIRQPPSAKFEPPPPLPGLSPKLPPSFAAQSSPRVGGEALSNLLELHYATPLVVSVDALEGAGEGLAERLSLSSQGSCVSLRSLVDDTNIIRSSPASTVLRPRSGRDYQVVERRRQGSESFSSCSPALNSPTYSTVFTYETCSLAHKSPASLSTSSGQSRDREPSPGRSKLTHSLIPSSSKERTPPPPPLVLSSLSSKDASPSAKVPVSKEPPLPLPPRRVRTCRRAQSEPSSAKCESPSAVSLSARSSPPSTPQMPSSPFMFSPEILEPMLNYAEIDLSTTAPITPPSEWTRHSLNYAEIDLSTTAPTTPPSELTRHLSRRQKKVPPKTVAVEYTEIDHTATSALKKAGQEHAQSREDNNSLRRGATAMSLARKNSAPATTKDRRSTASFSRERKLSACSMDSV